MGNKLMTTRHYHYHHHHHNHNHNPNPNPNHNHQLSNTDRDALATAPSLHSSCSFCMSRSRRSGDQSPSSDAAYFYDHVHTTDPTPANSESSFRAFGDDYESLDQVALALAEAGLGPSNLIVGIDFTSSNAWTGKKSFNGKNLHHLGELDSPNLYEQAISVIGRTLSTFDEDNHIPCYGFGDATTSDQRVFSFNHEDSPCHGFEQVLARYRELVPNVRPAGPTSFAPIIETAIRIVDQSAGQFHILMIIADGQVTRSVEIDDNHLSRQEESTLQAITKASEYPLSIIVVGVGDGPWNQMYECDDGVHFRAFDNVQFVNFTEIMMMNISPSKKDTQFALQALMEVPHQYKAMKVLGLLGNQRETTWPSPLNPPLRDIVSSHSSRELSCSSSSDVLHPFRSLSMNPSTNKKICQLCFKNEKDCAFGCGHQTCYQCGQDLFSCPTCQRPIQIKLQLK